MAISALLPAYNLRGDSQKLAMDERRRVKLVLVIWAIWAVATILAYCTMFAP